MPMYPTESEIIQKIEVKETIKKVVTIAATVALVGGTILKFMDSMDKVEIH